MATFAELKTRATNLFQDPDRSDSGTVSFGDLLNQGVSEIAGGMQSSLGDWVTSPLPELLVIGSIDTVTDAAYVSMPSNFQRGLQLAVRDTGAEVDIANSFIEFTETYPLLARSGIISEVVEHGRNFYYQGIPTVSETVTLHYYRKPVAMVDETEDTDTPDGIPEHLHYALLINFVGWKMNEFIEDGLEGETPNTQKYMNFFLAALKTLELSIPDYKRELQLI